MRSGRGMHFLWRSMRYIWKKLAKRQKCLDNGFHMIIVTFVQLFFFQKFTSVLFKTMVSFVYIYAKFISIFHNTSINFWIKKKNWTKITIIMLDPSFKHFYYFNYFFYMRRVLRRKWCILQTFFSTYTMIATISTIPEHFPQSIGTLRRICTFIILALPT